MPSPLFCPATLGGEPADAAGLIAQGAGAVVPGQAHLLEVVGAQDAGGGLADLLDGGEQQPDEDGDESLTGSDPVGDTALSSPAGCRRGMPGLPVSPDRPDRAPFAPRGQPVRPLPRR